MGLLRRRSIWHQQIYQIILAEIGHYLRRVKHSLFDEMIVANTLSQNYTGGDLAPYWNLYRQHFNSSVPINILQSLRIGSLHPDDIAALEKEKEPYCNSYQCRAAGLSVNGWLDHSKWTLLYAEPPSCSAPARQECFSAAAHYWLSYPPFVIDRVKTFLLF